MEKIQEKMCKQACFIFCTQRKLHQSTLHTDSSHYYDVMGGEGGEGSTYG